MGKASRWLINFLLGRKDDKVKKKNISIIFEDHQGSLMTIPSANPYATPLRRRWSFGKSSASKERAHNSSRSLDSVAAIPLVKQVVVDMEKQHDNTRVLAKVMANGTQKRSKSMEDEAATRIQAAFRSYLARKALHALRGLVKLQALVRGHLVRKQTTAALRSMHALITIQVRARFQRIRMAEESQHAVKSPSSEREAVGTNLYEKDGIVKNQNGFTNHSKIERIEQGNTRYYHSGKLAISKKEQKYEEFSFTTHSSPRLSPPLTFKPTPGRSSFSSHENPSMHNYMANTLSSRAKVRSHSEPKQRPKGNKRTAPADEMNDNNSNNLQLQKHSSPSSQSKGVADKKSRAMPHATLF